MAAAAPQLSALLNEVTGAALLVRMRCWDGSEAGPVDAPVLVINKRRALRRLLWTPDELGFAQAYVAGELDIEGDMTTAIQRFWAAVRELGLATPKLGLRTRARARAVLTAARMGAIGLKPPVPGEEARLKIEHAGFEVGDVHVLRVHYVHTIRAWLDTFESRFDEVVQMIGEAQSRVWRLYIVGSALAFEENRMGVDQILAVKPAASGDGGMPRTRDEWTLR